MDLTTRYMGLTLRNPVIVSSSGLTQTVEAVKKCEAAGAGAVVLKSIFEEEIQREIDGLLKASEATAWHPEAEEYISRFGRDNAVGRYLHLIREARQAVSIPVMASIHCASPGAWTDFARRIEEAGAHAIELNLFVLPSDPRRDGPANEKVYFDIAEAVSARVGIPVALKVGAYFSGLSHTLARLSRTGIRGLVLFNRFYRMDFDIENLRLTPAAFLSQPDEIVVPLRWISILSGTVECDLAAATGVHDGAGVVKHLLAGAAAVQVCSVLYRNGIETIGTILDDLGAWMERHGYESIDRFRGRMRQDRSSNPAGYERVQFMKFSGELENS